MFLFLFKIYLSIFELGYLIIQLHVGLFEIVYQWFILPPQKCVKNKLVVITGGAKGLGKELAIQFTQLGAVVAILDIDEVSLLFKVESIFYLFLFISLPVMIL